MNFARHELLKSILKEQNIVMLKDLEKRFPEVSSMTLRRDMDYLQSTGFAVKFRGGMRLAESDSGVREPAFSRRLSENTAAKKAIAEKAVPFLCQGRGVFLDAGTTILEMARILPDIKFSVITTGPNIALEVISRTSSAVSVVGGTLNKDNLTVSGPHSLAEIKSMNIDTAFIVPAGFSLSSGFTCGNYSENEIKRLVCQKASKVIMLMDSSKFGNSMPFTFAAPKCADVLITDRPLPAEIAMAFEAAGTKVIIADMPY